MVQHSNDSVWFLFSMGKHHLHVSDQVLHKSAFAVTEDGKRLKILDEESRGIVLVTAQLICIFVFTQVKIHFFS